MIRWKSITATICTAWAVTQPVMTFAASGVIELEIPGMNPVTAAAISDFTTNPCPATVEAIRTSVASNYDGVVVRKAEKRDELQAEADGLAVEPPLVLQDADGKESGEVRRIYRREMKK